jgi:hypothetical protein
MLLLPGDLAQTFSVVLDRKGFSGQNKANYLKWLRFYWDFCHKYLHDPYRPESFPLFLHKLQEKSQFEQQQKNVRHAVTFFIACNPVSLPRFPAPHRCPPKLYQLITGFNQLL